MPVTAAMSSSRSRLALALLPAFVTLVVIGLAFANARILKRDNESVDRTRLVIERSDAFLLHVMRSELGQRGYLLTGDSTFLTSVRGEKGGAEQVLDDIERLTADNASQRPRLDALERELTKGVELFAAAAASRTGGRGDSVSHAALLGEGRNRIERVRDLVGAVKAEEERLLGERQAATSRQARIASVVLLLGGALAVGIALVVNLILARIINESERMSRELGAQLDDLVAMKQELESRAARER